nr:rubredoxin [uncultured Cupriavidus sp.]
MYKKGAVLEIQFSLGRLNDGAGEPYWIDLSRDEATGLMETLQARLAANLPETTPPTVVSLDGLVASESRSTQMVAPAGEASQGSAFRQWICIICGWVYDEAEGLPEDGIAPGTRWEDIPSDWRCPLCDVGKEDFAMVPL